MSEAITSLIIYFHSDNMNCPKCDYKMASTELECPRCIKFGFISTPPLASPSVEPATSFQPDAVETQQESTSVEFPRQSDRQKVFKPTWFDYLMQVLTVFIIISQHGLAVLVAWFYCFLILAYILDWAVKGIQKFRGSKRA